MQQDMKESKLDINRQLTVRLLGRPQILINNKPLATLKRPKSYALLYYVIATPQPVSRRELGALLWPDSTLSAARNNLRNHLAAVRSQLGAYLTITSEDVIFNRTADCDIDIDLLKGLETHANAFMQCDAADLAEVRRILTLYRGDFLAGFTISYSDIFNDWVDKTREDLFVHFSQHLYHLSQVEVSQGNLDEAMKDVDRLITIVPWHEGGHRLKIQLLAGQGERWAALEQYATLTEVLRQELDVSPSEETEQLVTRIRHGLVEPTLSTVQTNIAIPTIQQIPPTSDGSSQASTSGVSIARHTSPVPLTPLLGHSVLLDKAAAILKNPVHRLVTLVGMGGVGKSHMALTLAQMVADRFEHGVCFVPLTGITESGAAEVEITNHFVSALGTALQLPMNQTDDVISQVTNYLRQRRILLIFDNFEHVLPAKTQLITQLITLLQNAPNCTILVTSQGRLSVVSETVLKVNPLPIPTLAEVEENLQTDQELSTVTSQPTEHYAVLQLFLDRARRSNPDFHLYQENFADIIEICHLTGGLPLALEMAATWTEHLTLPEIVTQLQQDHRVLLQGVTSEHSTHKSIDTLFDYSWQHLDEARKRSLLHTSHFTAAFDRNAVKAIADVSMVELKQLTDTSFLQQQSTGRYIVHPLAQRFLQHKWYEHYGLQSPESEQFWQAYATYYLDFLSERVEKMSGEEGERMMADLRREEAHITLAWQRAQNPEKEYDYAYLIATYAANQYTNEDALTYATRAYELATERLHDPQKQYETLLLRERLYAFMGQSSEREADLALLTTLASQKDAPAQQVEVALRQADLALLSGDFPAVETLTQTAIGSTDVTQTPAYLARAHLLMGQSFFSQADYEQAQIVLAEAQPLAESIEDDHLVAEVLLTLGNVSQKRARYNQAIDYYQQALHIYQAIGDVQGTGNAFFRLGVIKYLLFHRDEAKAYYLRALEISQRIGDKTNQGTILTSLGILSEFENEYEKGEAYLQQALAIQEEVGNMRGVSFALSGLGFITLNQENHDQAYDYYRRELGMSDEIGSKDRSVLALRSLGMIYRRQKGVYQQAKRYLERGVQMAYDLGLEELKGVFFVLIGIIFNRVGQYATAQTYIEEAMAAFQQADMTEWAGAALRYSGEYFLAQQEFGQAQDHFQQALAMSRTMSDNERVVDALTRLGWLAYKRGDHEQMLAHYQELSTLAQKRRASYYLAESQVGIALAHVLAKHEWIEVDITPTIDYIENEPNLLIPDYPFRLHLLCHHLLTLMNEPYADTLLRIAHAQLQDLASLIEDETWQQSYLENVPEHREVGRLYTGMSQS
ncbi:MAG: tetratricopeptide repeat protein [Chloroflexota bacterium]